MTRPLAIAFLGVEHYHSNFWAKAFAQSPGVSIAGVYDPNPAVAEAFARTHGVAVAADAAALAGGADAVAICGATADHPQMVAIAAAAGRPILCEKPIGATWADTRAIRDTLARTGVPFMQSFPKRFDPINAELREVLQSGRLGTLTLARVRHGHSHGLSEDFKKGWYADPARSGGGTLLDEGVHAADFIRFAFGDPSSVTATISSATLGLPLEDTAVATFAFAGGPLVEVATGWCFAGADNSIEIYGTRGSLVLSGVDLASRDTCERDFLRVYLRETPEAGWAASPTTPHFKTGIFHEHVAFAFVKALQEGGSMPVTMDDGIRAFAMIAAAYEAARTGVRQTIDYTGDR
ncbi:MAG: Gfo/Idh/MocA family oxidoreductase [Acuticoccus sp.]